MFLYLNIRYIDTVVTYKDHRHLRFSMRVSCVSGIEDLDPAATWGEPRSLGDRGWLDFGSVFSILSRVYSEAGGSH